MDRAFGMPKVIETFRQIAVDEPFRCVGDLTVFHPSFQNVPDIHSHLLADALGDHDLKFRLYGDGVYGAISSSTVKLYNFGLRSVKAQGRRPPCAHLTPPQHCDKACNGYDHVCNPRRVVSPQGATRKRFTCSKGGHSNV